LILVFALRRLLLPLKELAIEAGKVDAHSTGFDPPQSALQIRELRPLSQALSGTIRKLQRALHVQHRFLSDAAHELKTAVAIERSTIQLLSLRPRSAEEYSEGLNRVLQDNERLEQLVSRMLTLGRFEERPVTSSDSVDLGQSAHKMAESIRHWIEAREITLVLDVEKNVNVALSEEAAETLISNLLMNAVQHSASGSQVQLSVRVSSHAGGKATLQIADCGKGIASESLPHVFERFYREDRSRSRETGGAGLGLAICKSIVQGAGGNIEVESVLGRGTTATATLKLA
jgi:signal transduction histidine kinase